MHKESANKFNARNGVFSPFAFFTIILHIVGNSIFIHADDPMVADCDSMCIFAEIVNNRLCAIESFFAVRNPVLFTTGIQQFLKGIVVAGFFTASIIRKNLKEGG